MEQLFKKYAANEDNDKWENMIKRESKLYTRPKDIRSAFERDYTRIIHCNGYRRLKHKTQVFFSPQSDHICTRIEHVTHVESISYTIAKCLGLNQELTKAIAVAHDIGHSPFGHEGERILSEISLRDIGENFWHEKNGLNYVDKIELLEDNEKNMRNLNLTYAVRDGIVSHCGEIDENALKPREKYIDLNKYNRPNEYAPYTWEGCVVKISDKISYLARDIEDAISLGLLDENLDELYTLLNRNPEDVINNTVLINDLIYDLWNNSSPEKGLCFSSDMFEFINKLKAFNYKNIYKSEIVRPSNQYFSIVLNEIYNALKNCYDKENTLNNIRKMKKFYPELMQSFEEWLSNYWVLERNISLKNDVLFDITKEIDFYKAIIYYISGMTDNFAIDMYNKIIRF